VITNTGVEITRYDALLALWRYIAYTLILNRGASDRELGMLCRVEEQIATERGICLEVGTCRR
jgi:hypothetical protein